MDLDLACTKRLDLYDQSQRQDLAVRIAMEVGKLLGMVNES